jgi:hypothetical protein
MLLKQYYVLINDFLEVNKLYKYLERRLNMSILNKLTSKFKQKDIGDYTSGNSYKHGGHLWCNGIYYQPRDVSALIMYNEYSKQRIKDLENKIKNK